MTTSTNRKPDFIAYCKGASAKAPLREIGAIWNHEEGEGFNIQLVASPIDGKLVCFPPREASAESTAE